MATFVADADLTTHVTAANAMRAEPLPDHGEALVPRANVRAHLRLQAACKGRGMTAAEFLQFGAGEESDGYDWNLRLGVLFAFREASRSEEDRGQAFQDEIDTLLEQLKTADLLVGGEIWAPTQANSRIGGGSYDTSDDRFTLDDADDGRFPTCGDGTRL